MVSCWLLYINFGKTIFGIINKIMLRFAFKETVKNKKFMKTFFINIAGSFAMMFNFAGMPVAVLVS